MSIHEQSTASGTERKPSQDLGKGKNLTSISKTISSELKEFNEYFSGTLKSKVPLVDLITKYVLKQKGKRVRPLLVLLSAKLLGDANIRSYRGAVLVELLHTATLVHDDVVDNAETRRSLPSINAVWKNKAAVLMGDYLLAKGLMIAVEGEDFDFLKIITNTVKRMSEGELLQIQKTRKLDIDEMTYYQIISDKTASLIQTCCEIGVRSKTDDLHLINSIRVFGENLGLAFQIKDDILDIEGTTKLFGKPIGGDIKEKKITLPLISAMANAGKQETSKIKSLLKGNDKNRVRDIIAFIKNYGGLEYAFQKAVSLGEEAKQSLNIFPDSKSKESLNSLVDYVIYRER